MPVGLQATKADIDNRSGGLARDLDNVLASIETFQLWLLATPDETLTSAPYSYTSQEVAILKSAFTEMDLLRQVYYGLAARTPAAALNAFSKQLYDFR
jgi:hypothetical protein